MIKKIISFLLLVLCSSSFSQQLDVYTGCYPGGIVIASGHCYYGDGSYAPHPPNAPPARGRSRPAPQQPTYLPSKYGAIAMDMTTGNLGSVTGYDSQESANRAALQDCDAAGCVIFGGYANQCAALAGGYAGQGLTGFTGVRYGLTRELAEKEALSSCKEKAVNCFVMASDCAIAGYPSRKYGAIALDRTTGNIASVTGYRAQEPANRAALKKCGSQRCEAIVRYVDECVALVSGKGSREYMGMGSGLTRQNAENKALAECRKETQTCTVLASDCSLPF